jgi:hypothetical protein
MVLLFHVWQLLPAPPPPFPPASSAPSLLPLPPHYLPRACSLLLHFFSHVPLHFKASARSAYCFSVLPQPSADHLGSSDVFPPPPPHDIRRFAGTSSDPQHRGVGRTVYIQDPFLPAVNLGRCALLVVSPRAC